MTWCRCGRSSRDLLALVADPADPALDAVDGRAVGLGPVGAEAPRRGWAPMPPPLRARLYAAADHLVRAVPGPGADGARRCPVGARRAPGGSSPTCWPPPPTCGGWSRCAPPSAPTTARPSWVTSPGRVTGGGALDPLDGPEVRDLVATQASARQADSWGDLIAARAGGNPFFVTELLRHLRGRRSAEGGAAAQHRGRGPRRPPPPRARCRRSRPRRRGGRVPPTRSTSSWPPPASMTRAAEGATRALVGRGPAPVDADGRRGGRRPRPGPGRHRRPGRRAVGATASTATWRRPRPVGGARRRAAPRAPAGRRPSVRAGGPGRRRGRRPAASLHVAAATEDAARIASAYLDAVGPRTRHPLGRARPRPGRRGPLRGRAASRRPRASRPGPGPEPRRWATRSCWPTSSCPGAPTPCSAPRRPPSSSRPWPCSTPCLGRVDPAHPAGLLVRAPPGRQRTGGRGPAPGRALAEEALGDPAPPGAALAGHRAAATWWPWTWTPTPRRRGGPSGPGGRPGRDVGRAGGDDHRPDARPRPGPAPRHHRRLRGRGGRPGGCRRPAAADRLHLVGGHPRAGVDLARGDLAAGAASLARAADLGGEGGQQAGTPVALLQILLHLWDRGTLAVQRGMFGRPPSVEDDSRLPPRPGPDLRRGRGPRRGPGGRRRGRGPDARWCRWGLRLDRVPVARRRARLPDRARRAGRRRCRRRRRSTPGRACRPPGSPTWAPPIACSAWRRRRSATSTPPSTTCAARARTTVAEGRRPWAARSAAAAAEVLDRRGGPGDDAEAACFRRLAEELRPTV